MADQTFRSGDQAGQESSHGFEKAATATKSVTDQALSASREIKDKAIGLASASSETIQNQASDFVDAAKDVASQATDKLKETVDGQKTAGADYVSSLAGRRHRRSKAWPIQSGPGSLMILCEGPNPSHDGSLPHFSEWPCSPASVSSGF
jgi:hypothetical protein